MNWITTNLRLPEEMYMDLKIKAAQERKSIAAVIREKLAGDTTLDIEEKKTKKLLNRMNALSEKIAKSNKGLNLTQAVITARYEQ